MQSKNAILSEYDEKGPLAPFCCTLLNYLEVVNKTHIFLRTVNNFLATFRTAKNEKELTSPYDEPKN